MLRRPPAGDVEEHTISPIKARLDGFAGPIAQCQDHAVRSNAVSILDAPNFGDSGRSGVAANYEDGKPERRRAVFRDFVICNCKPLVEVRWTREQGVRFHSTTQTWEHEFPVYKDVSIEAAPADALDWINLQLQGDAAGKQYPLLP